MKLIAAIIGAALLAAFQPTQADAEEVIYRVSGVTDSGAGNNSGVATAIICTNFTPATQTVNVNFRNAAGNLITPCEFTIGSQETMACSTHRSNFIVEDEAGGGNVIQHGSATVTATARRIHCSAMVIDASSFVPQGVSLHMVR